MGSEDDRQTLTQIKSTKEIRGEEDTDDSGALSER